MDGFEWDETKAAANLEKHGIDFQGAVRIFEAGSILRGAASHHFGEEGEAE